MTNHLRVPTMCLPSVCFSRLGTNLLTSLQCISGSVEVYIWKYSGTFQCCSTVDDAQEGGEYLVLSIFRCRVDFAIEYIWYSVYLLKSIFFYRVYLAIEYIRYISYFALEYILYRVYFA